MKLPLKALANSEWGNKLLNIRDSAGNPLAFVQSLKESDAVQIMVAVNNHAKLVAALEALVYPEDPDDMNAITLATGTAQALLAKVAIESGRKGK